MEGIGSFLDIFCLVVAAGIFIAGIYEIVKGEPVGRDVTGFKKDVVREFAKKEGPVYMLIGAAGIFLSLITKYQILPMTPWYFVGLAILIGGIALDVIIAKKYLVK